MPATPSSAQIPGLLDAIGRGEVGASAELATILYGEIHAMAERIFASQPRGHTLQPTALAHEAYARLLGADKEWAGRDHFFAAAAIAMRQALVDHARRRGAAKRGGQAHRVTLDEPATLDGRRDIDILALHEALERLAALDGRKAQVVSLRFFGGMTGASIATALGVSRKTVAEDWAVARAWLARELG